ncbi:hypothetical protein ACQPYE_27145 [Actinosynnema sp. CA-299493]
MIGMDAIGRSTLPVPSAGRRILYERREARIMMRRPTGKIACCGAAMVLALGAPAYASASTTAGTAAQEAYACSSVEWDGSDVQAEGCEPEESPNLKPDPFIIHHKLELLPRYILCQSGSQVWDVIRGNDCQYVWYEQDDERA